MSRSRRKPYHSYYRFHKGHRYNRRGEGKRNKNVSNRCVRKYPVDEHIPDGCHYKRLCKKHLYLYKYWEGDPEPVSPYVHDGFATELIPGLNIKRLRTLYAYYHSSSYKVMTPDDMYQEELERIERLKRK